MRYISKLEVIQFLNEGYRYEHSAPDRNGCGSIYNLSGCYPDDIYSHEAGRLYGDNLDEYSDGYSLWVINQVRGRPNADIKIYRAVPDMNIKLDGEIRNLTRLINHYLKFNFFPPGDDYVHFILDKYVGEGDYNKRREAVFDWMTKERERLKKGRVKLGINNGDWVTINKAYAINHGRTQLNNRYKILVKTVKAKHVYSNGDSIHEWGYDPT